VEPHEKERSSDLDEIRRASGALKKDLQVLVGAVRREREQIERRVQERPLVALGAAFGVGFILGGGLASRIGGWLLVSTVRMVAGQALRQFTAQLAQGGDEDYEEYVHE
jgi:hypothetical protein